MSMHLARMRSRLSELLRHPGFRRNPPLVAARVATWAAHCATGTPARIRLSKRRIRLQLPPKWRGGGATAVYLFREWYEPEFRILERLLRPGMVFIDGGANTGGFCFEAARLVTETGTVLAFEPGRRCYRALQQSAALNAFEQIHIRPEALADECGKARLYHHAGQENSYSLGAATDESVSFDEIETTTLARALAKYDLDRVDFIKLDVEGAQEPALRGGLTAVRRDLPHVLIENHEQACRRLGLDPNGAFELLCELGYEFYRVTSNGTVERLASAVGTRSVLAIHPDRKAREGSQ